MVDQKIMVKAELTPTMVMLIEPFFEKEIREGLQWPIGDGRTGMKFTVSGTQAERFKSLMRVHMQDTRVRVNYLGLDINPN